MLFDYQERCYRGQASIKLLSCYCNEVSVLVEPQTSPISLLSHCIRDRVTASKGTKHLTPILYLDQSKQANTASRVASFLANEFPFVSVHPHDKYLLCTTIVNIRIDNRSFVRRERMKHIPGLKFLAMVVFVHGLTHAASNAYHLGIPELTDSVSWFTRPTLDVASKRHFLGVSWAWYCRAVLPRLQGIAYFMMRSPAGKVYKIGIYVQQFLSGYRYLRCFCADIEQGLRPQKVVLLHLIFIRWKK